MARHIGIRAAAGAIAAIAITSILPAAALAQAKPGFNTRGVFTRKEAENRQNTKNQWRNLTILGGAAAAYGLLKGDPTVAIVGAAGALYSLNRYEQDRKSQDAAARARADIFSRPYFERNGQRFERRTVTRNGQNYYQFVRK